MAPPLSDANMTTLPITQPAPDARCWWCGSGGPSNRPSAGRQPAFGWDSLTDTERSVADLVARGLSNRQVATHLFLSRHTVGSHLRRIFRKLEITSRVELTRLVVLHHQDGREPPGSTDRSTR
jgi:DNA-binding CsgD family transcriptional regulator